MPDEYDLPLGFDINKIVSDVRKVKSELADLNAESEKSGKRVQTAFDNASKSSAQLSTKLKTQSVSLGATTRSIENMKDALSDLQQMAFSEKDTAKVRFYNQEIQKVKNEINQASNIGKKGFDELGNAVGKSTNYLTKAFGGLRFIANILPGIGVAGLLAFAVEPILKYVQSLGFFKEKIDEIVKTRQMLADVNTKGAQNAQLEIVQLNTLYATAQNVLLTDEQRFNAAKKLQDQYPQTFKNYSIEQIELGKVDGAILKLTNSIIALARARASEQQIAENSSRVLTDEQQIAEERLNNLNIITKISKAEKTLADVRKANGGTTNANTGVNNNILTAETALNDLLNKRADSDKKINDYAKDREILNKRNLVLAKNIVDQQLKGAEIAAPKEASADKTKVDRQKQLNAELLRLRKEYESAQLEAIEDSTEKALAKERAASAARIADYENRKKLFPELQITIDQNIELERAQSELRLALITKQGEEERQKQIRASQTEIAKILKEETQIQTQAINDKYAVLVAEAKRLGTLTAQTEKDLEIARLKEIDDILLKAQDERIKKQEAVALSGIYTRKIKEGQSEKQFETQNQIDILNIQIKFAKQRLALIVNDPAKELEANNLKKAIYDAQKQLNGINKKRSLFDVLGINEESFKVIQKSLENAAGQFGNFFGALADGAQARVDAIQEQIDAIDRLIDAQQNAVDKEKDLMDQGFANDYANAQRRLEATKQQREQLLKEQEEAQKRQQALQRAQIVADSIVQGSNLITAATEILKGFSKFPLIGQILSIAAIAAMFATFGIAKVTAFNATKMAEGGTIGGKYHADGGNKFVSMDGNSFMEHEYGEEVIKRKSAEKHRKTLKAINNDDFSGLSVNDISIREMMAELGLISHADIASEASQRNINITNEGRAVVINSFGKSEEYLKSMDSRLKSIEKQNADKPQLLEFDTHYLIIKGNRTIKILK